MEVLFYVFVAGVAIYAGYRFFAKQHSNGGSGKGSPKPGVDQEER